ncbi:hypothetical protein QF049_001019 [Paenibacillus sp. W4I10]|uniref:hypothetical protein n=1 Tax=Paenibacillus sp. W4I10 TaxID=3042298 RepID=UPI00277D73D7|nr:hypothetical protein [Paenibacillus sp. W4I10]MDQ0719758.1 hypothetical protein [Paenibacillus sp. W4I10]
MALHWYRKSSPAACVAGAAVRVLLKGMEPDEALQQTLYNGRHTDNPEEITFDELNSLKATTHGTLSI